jgi:subfamily B ATP-binding cassette protein MsbA
MPRGRALPAPRGAVESAGVLAFALTLVQPYWTWLILVLLAMLVETAMTLASPWPLKIVLDSVFDWQPLPAFLSWLLGYSQDRFVILNAAVFATVLIALLQAGAAYVNAYYTVIIGRWIAHDLRQSVYAHLHRLSMSYHNRRQTGPLSAPSPTTSTRFRILRPHRFWTS